MGNQNIPTPPNSQLRWRKAESTEPVIEQKKSIILSFSQVSSSDPYQDTFKVLVPSYGEQVFQMNKGEITTSRLIKGFFFDCVMKSGNPNLDPTETYKKILVNIFEPVVAGEAEIKGMFWQNPSR